MDSHKPARRTFLAGALALNAAALLGSTGCDSPSGGKKNAPFPKAVKVPSNRQKDPKAFVAARSVSITSTGARETSADNSAALLAALERAGRHGEVTIPAGTFAVTQQIAWPDHPVRVRGEGRGSKPSVLAFGKDVVHGFGVRHSGADGSWVSNLTMTGTSAAQIFIENIPGRQFVVDSCTFVDAAIFGVQVSDAHLYITNSRFFGPADGSMTAVHAMKAGTKVTAQNSWFTGCFRGLYCAGVDDLTVRDLTVNPMWWCGNAASGATQLVSATATSLTVKDPVTMAPENKKCTVTAWKKLTDGATLTPAAGRQGWYTLTGAASVEPRLLIRSKDVWGTILETNGNQVRIHSFYDWRTCHPVPTPATTLSGVVVERPYVAGIATMNGTTVALTDRWKAGARSTVEIPPAGARISVVPIADYQVFTTQGSKSMSATGCTILNSWADSISTIASSDAYVANNDIWDSQDVGITIQQGAGACRVENNTMYRIGTAGVFVGTSNAQVVNNRITGAQHTAVREDSYGALQVEGAEKVAVEKNTVTYGGSPFEIRGMVIEGRYGPFPSTEPKKGPFATDGYYRENKFVGYPAELTIPAPPTEPGLRMSDVTVRGKKASAKSADWAGARVQALDGASKGAIGA